MPFFLMRCLHHDGQDAPRERVRPDHRAWVSTGGPGLVSVLIGSALLNAGGEAIGNFGILEAACIDDARAFAEGDPYHRAGIVRELEIAPLPDTFQAQRIREPMSPRLKAGT